MGVACGSVIFIDGEQFDDTQALVCVCVCDRGKTTFTWRYLMNALLERGYERELM